MSDGASAVLLMSKEKADQLGLKPKAKIVARSVVGSDPTLMLTGPIPATEKVLKKANLTIEQIDRYEVNEAFAPVPLAWLQETGTKLIVSLMNELERCNGKYGILAI